MQTQKEPNGGGYGAVTDAGYGTEFGIPGGSQKVTRGGHVLSDVRGRPRTESDDLQIVLFLVLLAAAVKSLVVTGMYWSDAISKAAFTVPQFLITMALTLTVVVAFAGLIAFACIKGKGIERANVVQRAHKAGLSEGKLLESGVYTDPWSRQGGLRIALSTALGGVWAASLITYGMYWHNAAKVATAGAAHWVAGAIFLVAAAVGMVSIVALALGRGRGQRATQTAEESQAVFQPLQAKDAGPAHVVADVARDDGNSQLLIPGVIAGGRDGVQTPEVDLLQPQPAVLSDATAEGVGQDMVVGR